MCVFCFFFRFHNRIKKKGKHVQDRNPTVSRSTIKRVESFFVCFVVSKRASEEGGETFGRLETESRESKNRERPIAKQAELIFVIGKGNKIRERERGETLSYDVRQQFRLFQ